MKHLMNALYILAVSCLCTSAVLAQETPACTDADKAALDSCMAQAEASCLAAVPQCQKQPVSLEELNAAIDQKCGDCSATSTKLPKNYGQYRSCAMSVVNTLKTFSLIDLATKKAVLAKTKACKAILKSAKGNNGNKGENGHGPK